MVTTRHYTFELDPDEPLDFNQAPPDQSRLIRVRIRAALPPFNWFSPRRFHQAMAVSIILIWTLVAGLIGMLWRDAPTVLDVTTERYQQVLGVLFVALTFGILLFGLVASIAPVRRAVVFTLWPPPRQHQYVRFTLAGVDFQGPCGSGQVPWSALHDVFLANTTVHLLCDKGRVITVPHYGLFAGFQARVTFNHAARLLRQIYPSNDHAAPNTTKAYAPRGRWTLTINRGNMSRGQTLEILWTPPSLPPAQANPATS